MTFYWIALIAFIVLVITAIIRTPNKRCINKSLFPSAGIVYLLTVGEYDDYHDVGIASSSEKAKEFMDQFPDEEFNEPKKVIIDNFIKVPKGKSPYFVRVRKDITGIIEVRKLSEDIYNAELAIKGKIELDRWEAFMVYVWAENSKEAESLAVKKVKAHKAIISSKVLS